MKMDELAVYLKEVFCIELLSAILSNPRDREKAWKVRIRPVLKKEELVFQFEVFIGKQVFHENLSVEEAVQRACEWLEQFRQMQIDTKSERATVLVSKKGKVTVKRKKSQPVGYRGTESFPQPGEAVSSPGGDGYSVFKGSGRDDTGWQDCSFPV